MGQQEAEAVIKHVLSCQRGRKVAEPDLRGLLYAPTSSPSPNNRPIKGGDLPHKREKVVFNSVVQVSGTSRPCFTALVA